MPLYDLSATEAIETCKANPLSEWGSRSGENRVEPLAKPGFDVPFRLKKNEPIFTVGSCFARNVEVELMRRGFRVPMRELFKHPDFVSFDPGIINNFGTPSIYNEFAWAFGEEDFVPEQHIVEVQAGRFADLHLVPSIRPESWEVALKRRQRITDAFRSVAGCRAIIVTLGLVEVWFDTRTRYYLNARPRPSLVRAEPDRFRLHVLSFEETLHYLERTLRIVRERANPEIQVLLSVSPVPLAATHRPQDVIVANMYSKSVLRTVAETACARHDFVTYFPSYESVTLSDRLRAWADDLTHVTHEIVALNVGRMVDAFSEDGAADVGEDDLFVDGDVHSLHERAVRLRAEGNPLADRFFSHFSATSERSAPYALEHAAFLAGLARHAEALEVLERAPTGEANERLALAKASSLLALGRGGEAFALLNPLATPTTKTFAIWRTLLLSACAAGDSDKAAGVVLRWTRTHPFRTSYAYIQVGRWHLERGEIAQARSYLEQAVSVDAESAQARILLAEALIAVGCRDDAREILKPAAPQTPSEKKLFERIQATLA